MRKHKHVKGKLNAQRNKGSGDHRARPQLAKVPTYETELKRSEHEIKKGSRLGKVVHI